MSHTYHIAKNKQNLELRFQIIKLIREWFWLEKFTEVETPSIVELTGQEPNLAPMKVSVLDERNKQFLGYLHTSPEYTMKKMLSAGFGDIFYLGKCFRNEESFGGLHNPEFTMLEWYRIDCDFYKIMEDVKNLFNFVLESLVKNFKFEILNLKTILNNQFFQFRKIEMRTLWSEFVDINLDDYLEKDELYELCESLGYKPNRDESYEELFYRIFLDKIEPNLIEPTIVYNYPAQMAALSKISDSDSRYAERFEVYIDGMELANAFSELTDADEQLKRLQEEQKERKKQGKEVYEIDMEFIEALKNMPESSGIALGVDRLVQVFSALRQGSGQGCKNIDNVIVLPASKLFG